jgi:hypothetical protein
MRTIGGMFNFELVSIYIRDYTDYIILNKIVDIWDSFPEDMLDFHARIKKWWFSESTLSFFYSIPAKVAGEGFVNNVSDEKKNDDDEEVVETFVSAIINIGKAFVAIGKVFISIVNVITDPLKFILFIISWFISFGLLVMWIIVGLVFVFVTSWVLLLLWKIIKSSVWLSIYLIFVIIFGALAVIDGFLGGFIMKAMRCENYPSNWVTQPKYHKKNIFQRLFLLCSIPCNKKYYPYGLLCIRSNKAEPILAPHQVIYQSYDRENFIASSKDKLIYSYKPKYNKYPLMTEKEKLILWKNIYSDRTSYIEETIEGYKNYEKIVESACYIMKNTMEEGENKDNVMQMCQSLFCYDEVENKNFCNKVEFSNYKEKEKLIIVFLLLVCMLFIVYFVLSSMDSEENIIDIIINSIKQKVDDIKSKPKVKKPDGKIKKMMKDKLSKAGKAIGKAVTNVKDGVSTVAEPISKAVDSDVANKIS